MTLNVFAYAIDPDLPERIAEDRGPVSGRPALDYAVAPVDAVRREVDAKLSLVLVERINEELEPRLGILLLQVKPDGRRIPADLMDDIRPLDDVQGRFLPFQPVL